VDKRILPGFQYRVRKLGGRNPERYLFRGKALALQSIGMGYGKRITFEGDTLNQNSNYFYSDTNPAGFALSLVAVSAGDQFTVTTPETEHPVAEVRLIEVESQEEIDCVVEEDMNLVKRVQLSFCFDVDYASDHGLMALYSRQRLQATGTAVVERKKNARKAFTTFIEGIELPHHGPVTLKA